MVKVIFIFIATNNNQKYKMLGDDLSMQPLSQNYFIDSHEYKRQTMNLVLFYVPLSMTGDLVAGKNVLTH